MKDERPPHCVHLQSTLVVLSFGVYILTLCPTVYLGDSGELTAAAFSLGIPHNSGYPLYSLLGKLFCLIPLGNVGFRTNLMSALFAVGCLWLVFRFVIAMCRSRVAAFSTSLILAFTPLFWLQAVSSEVYSMHLFFIALLINILWKWDRQKDFYLLCLFVFVAGLSLGNHLQTVMLAPAIIFLILSRDRKVLFRPQSALILALLFVVALLAYTYLPVRTDAGAAIHWGDPNNLERFVAHVTGQTHREIYVLQKSFLEYFQRTNQTLLMVGTQLGVIFIIGIWGLIRLRPRRWQLVFSLIILFDFVYTVFLNVISLKVTPFAVPTLLCLLILAGFGIAGAVRWVETLPRVGFTTKVTVKACWCLAPAIPLLLNFDSSAQSSNYTAYEHALNTLRTPEYGSILFLEGDNHFFPVAYARIAEKMRPDLLLFDRHNILFKMPYVGQEKGLFFGKWEEYRAVLEKEIARRMSPLGIYYLSFVPDGVTLPGNFRLVPAGILHKVERKKGPSHPYRIKNVWKYYSTESFYDDFEKDFMTRQVQAHFHLRYGHYLFLAKQPDLGLRYLRNASRIGNDDSVVHSRVSDILVENGHYEEARIELIKALNGKENSEINNGWGIYYYKMGDYGKALDYFQAAVKMKPREYSYLKNLGLALYKLGETEAALRAIRESLSLNRDQPDLLEILTRQDPGSGKVQKDR